MEKERAEKVVYIVHCIDTEGPLYESLEATFERIETSFNIKLPPTKENLEKLRKKEIFLNGNEEAVLGLISEEYLNYNSNWEEIDAMLDEITSENFRFKLKDSFGGGWVYNWFCVDYVGFTGENPRRKDLGCHKIFDHYKEYNKRKGNKQDMIQWHFHPMSIKKDAHRGGNAYFNSPVLFEILARKIIDRQWFPTAFRPGFHTERPDSNLFLEQWIPFDYANQFIEKDNYYQDLSEGQFGDWRMAPKEWKIYHPSHDNYQKEGSCKRWIARCLNIRCRVNQLKEDDLREAFKRAQLGKPTLVSFTNHDVRKMKKKLNDVKEMIRKISEEFPEVKFKFCNAIEGFRRVINPKNITTPKFEIQLKKTEQGKINKIYIRCKNKIFGPQPFFALKTKKGEYIWQNLDFQGENQWSFTFDFYTIDFLECEKIGIAANSPEGVTEIVLINTDDLNIENKVYMNNAE